MAAKSAWSAVLRIFVSFLLVGILYQTWVLRRQHSTQSTLEDLRDSIAQRLEHLNSNYDQQAVFDNHHLDVGPSVSFANYTALLEKATYDAFSLPSLPQPSRLQQAITSARSAAQLAPKDGWPLPELPHTISTSLKYISDPTLLRLNAEALKLNHGDSRPPPINEAPPALIVALETGTRRDDHEGGHLSQYAFAAAPGHPMFLDLLQHIVEVSRAVDQLRAAGDNRTWNLDRIVYTWTGPEIWSSAVWRYLWARWGFDSRRLHGTSHPVRVGDVLILPFLSFHAPWPEPKEDQPPEACLWHGFSGYTRWKHTEEEKKKEV